jgi:hypothetical protein
MYRADGLVAMKDGREACTEGPGGRVTLGDIDKRKSTWVMKTASTKLRRRTMASWHLAETEHASAWMM